MSEEQEEVFVCFHRAQDGEFEQVITGTSEDDVINRDETEANRYRFVERGRIHNENNADQDTPKSKTSNESSEDNLIKQTPPLPEETLANLCYTTISEIDSNILRYHQLIALTSFMRKALQRIGVKSNLYEIAKEKGKQIKSDDKIELFSLPPKDFPLLSDAIGKMQETDEGMEILPSSILLSLVASFDSLIGDFARTLLNIYPDKMEAGEKTISFKDLFAIEDLLDLRKKLINDEVSDLLRGSHAQQAAYLERLIDTDITKHYSRWPNFIEVFERRNAYAHTNGVANPAYLANLRKIKYPIGEIKIGDHLRLNESYLHKAVDYLAEFGTLVALVSWRKLGNQPNEAFEALGEASYSLITKRRYRLAIWLLDFALHQQPKKGVKDVVIRRMTINLANAYKKSDNFEMSKKTIAEIDWTATSRNFQLAIASLEDDVPKAIDMLPKAAAAGDVKAEHIREWPIFDWIRNDEKFRNAFEDTFGEKLSETSDAPPQDMQPSEAKETKH